MKLKQYLNENTGTFAFWISPRGEIHGSTQKHISQVLSDPQKFGISFERIKKLHDQFGEPIGTEGKAREEIIRLLVRKGWIRIRKYVNKFWSINVFHAKMLKKDYLYDWAQKVTTKGINGFRERDVYMPVVITDLGSYRKETTVKELAAGNVFECKNRPILKECEKISDFEDSEENYDYEIDLIIEKIQ